MDNEGFAEIDIMRLDQEWIRQPKYFHEFATQEADAQKEMDEAKSALDLVRADVDKAVRLNPESFGIAKVTENAIQSAILQAKEYQEANQDLIEAKHKVALLGAAVKALDHRKKALENLVALHGRDYFSTPMTRENREETDRVERRAARRKGIRKGENGG
jgi:hypothetical protein